MSASSPDHEGEGLGRQHHAGDARRRRRVHGEQQLRRRASRRGSRGHFPSGQLCFDRGVVAYRGRRRPACPFQQGGPSMRRLFRRPALAFVAGALPRRRVVGGRAAYAALADDVVTACFKPSNGTLYLVGGRQPPQRRASPANDRSVGTPAAGWQPGGWRGRRRRRQRHERRTRARRRPELPARRQQVHVRERRHVRLQRRIRRREPEPERRVPDQADDTGIELEGPADGSASTTPASPSTRSRRWRCGDRSSTSTLKHR